jgi:UDP-N-acetylmuramoyl-tripeptide--D-alanyl-D-alanine ligase
MSLSDFARRSNGVLVGHDVVVNGFATDSRAVVEGDLFLCIRGERVDGHEFASQARSAGAVACLSERPVSEPYVLVDDIADGLARFGQSKRDEFYGPVLGVTGSTGKTSTKDFVAAALSPLGPVLKSQGNKNTEYTSPLVWAELQDDTAAVVIEMAMRGHGQIAHLASISKPTIGVVTNIGTSHVEKVGSRHGVFQAKSELLQALPKDGTAVFWREDAFYGELRDIARCTVLTFGFSLEADCQILGYQALDWEHCLVRGQLAGDTFEVKLNTVGRHQALNAAAAVTAAHAAGVKVQDATSALPSAEHQPMRLEVVERDGITIVLDTYNASPDSTVAALQTLADVPARGRKIAILGEMKELGSFTESGHRLVGKALAQSSVSLALLTGGPTSFIADEARMAGMPPDTVIELEVFDIEEVRRFLAGLVAGDVVLIKGSRALGLEAAVR